MKFFLGSIFAVLFGVITLAFARSAANSAAPAVQTGPSSNEPDARLLVEGEKRFRANCGRCHQSPHKFPPRAMAMAVRHMRVRGMLTDDDMKYVLYYVTH